MSSPAYCPSSLMPANVPVEFSRICRNLLARDALYGPLIAASDELPFDGLWAMSASDKPVEFVRPITPLPLSGSRSHDS